MKSLEEQIKKLIKDCNKRKFNCPNESLDGKIIAYENCLTLIKKAKEELIEWLIENEIKGKHYGTVGIDTLAMQLDKILGFSKPTATNNKTNQSFQSSKDSMKP